MKDDHPERPFLIHYIVAGGRSTDLCSAFVQVKRMIPGGGEEIIELFRLVFSSGTSAILGTIGVEFTK